MGLLDMNFPGNDTAEGQGLLSAAMSLLSAQKMPGQRGSLANALGQAGQAYMGGTNSARKAMLQNKYMQSQVDENDMQTKIRQAELELKQRKRTALPGLFGMQGNGALTSPGMGAQPSGQIDYMAALQAGFTPDEITKLGGLQNLGRQERSYSQDVEGPNGQKILRSFDKYGSAMPGDVSGYVAPQLVNQGDRQSFVKPSAGLSLPVGMSPSDRDASARGWAGVQNSRDRLAFDRNGGSEGGKPQLADGQFVYKPSAQFPQGRVVAVPGIIDKPLTESQGAATNFGMRSIKAHENLKKMEDVGGGQMGGIKRFMTAATPGLGMGLDDSMGAMTNWTQSAEQQMSEQARLDFLTAVLRKESGASISPSEHINGQRQYFAQPNDSDEVLAQKQANRATAIEGLRMQSGPGGKHIKPTNSGGASGSFADNGKEARYQQWKRENGQ